MDLYTSVLLQFAYLSFKENDYAIRVNGWRGCGKLPHPLRSSAALRAVVGCSLVVDNPNEPGKTMYKEDTGPLPECADGIMDTNLLTDSRAPRSLGTITVLGLASDGCALTKVCVGSIL